MQIKPGVFPPVMLRTVMFSVLLQEMNALLEPGDSKLMRGETRARQKTRSRTSALQPVWERHTQKTVGFVDRYWNHVVCPVSLVGKTEFKCSPLKMPSSGMSGNEHALTKQNENGANLLSSIANFSSKTPTSPNWNILHLCRSEQCWWVSAAAMALAATGALEICCPCSHIRFSLQLHQGHTDWRGFPVPEECCKKVNIFQSTQCKSCSLNCSLK